jgi:phosphatidylserine/phosphatidylglycerophosphate/cardiolipin synthase-like enzyme
VAEVWGSLQNVKVYQPIDNVRNTEILGSHAKFCLVDGEKVYIGSANITNPGLGQHIEMGILGKKDLAKKVEKLWDYLDKHGFLKELTIDSSDVFR